MSNTVHSLLDHDNLLDRSLSDISIAIEDDFPVDENVIAHLPGDTKVLSAHKYGFSPWTITACITTELADGTPKKFFLKCVTEDAGQTMMEGEYWAMTELYNTIPAAIPKPLARVRFKTKNPATYFFLCEFAEISGDPNPDRLCARIIELHEKSLMVHVMAEDVKTNGSWPDLEDTGARLVSHVIPRLVGALQIEGRSVKPCLIHGDLREGNTGTLDETGDIVLFDAGSYYAHNEMEIGDWRCPYNKVNSKAYTDTYRKHHADSEPAQEWDDRNRLYSTYYDIVYSVNYMHEQEGRSVRHIAYGNMCYLVDKYAPLARW
ncbi:hypothetical protein BDR22DRAFT_881198 [Usnea florida]